MALVQSYERCKYTTVRNKIHQDFNCSKDEIDQLVKMLNRKLFPSLRAVGMEATYNALIFLAIIIAISNIYVLTLFVRRRELRSRSNTLLISLCLSDSAIWLLGLPLVITTFKILDKMKLSDFFSSYVIMDTLSSITFLFNGFLSIFNLSAVIGDRALSLFYPFVHRTSVTKAKLVILIVSIWISSLVLSAIPVTWKYHEFSGKDFCDFYLKKKDASENYDRKYGIGFVCVEGVLVICIAGCFIKMFFIIRGRKRPVERTRRKRSVTVKQEMKATVILLLMFLSLLTWLTPSVYKQVTYTGSPEIRVATWLSHWKSYFKLCVGRFLVSVINPVLYIMYKIDFVRAVKNDWTYVCSAFDHLCTKCGICRESESCGTWCRKGKEKYTASEDSYKYSWHLGASSVGETPV